VDVTPLLQPGDRAFDFLRAGFKLAVNECPAVRGLVAIETGNATRIRCALFLFFLLLDAGAENLLLFGVKIVELKVEGKRPRAIARTGGEWEEDVMVLLEHVCDASG
jgi:hypothetical protein